ncbi:SsgA family sporulation/cell division regulator [Actinacidiphila alni]|uniref:SsgA family sporulation/cell division regulator n=1 Tax=Actinacidiphila alni TaxID=380248 RepID=UPI003407B405
MIEVPGDGVVTVRTTGCLDLPGDAAALVAAEFVYRPRDCFAVDLLLRGPDGATVGWTFSWELLSQGLVGPVGDGDIRIRPENGTTPVVEVLLEPHCVAARIRFPARDIGYFISRVRAAETHRERRAAEALDRELASIMEET